MLTLLACTPTWTEDCRNASGVCATAETALPTETGSPDTWASFDSAPADWVATIEDKALYFDTIQDAIVEAADGDTIWVAPGRHVENVDFHGKGIRLVSVAGPLATILDGGGRDSVVQIRAQEPATAVLEGFTLTNGVGTDEHGGGVFVENAAPTLRHNIVVGNSANVAGGIYMRHGTAIAHNNLVLENTANVGGGIVCTNCQGAVRFNTLWQNTASEGPAGEWYYEPQGDFHGNLVVTPDDAPYAFRYMEPRGYAFEADYNLVHPDVPWADSDTQDGSIWPVGPNDTTGTPAFVDAEGGDFRLGSGSDAIDAGPEHEQDADGSRADIGAFGGPDGGWDPGEGWEPG